MGHQGCWNDTNLIDDYNVYVSFIRSKHVKKLIIFNGFKPNNIKTLLRRAINYYYYVNHIFILIYDRSKK